MDALIAFRCSILGSYRQGTSKVKDKRTGSFPGLGPGLIHINKIRLALVWLPLEGELYWEFVLYFCICTKTQVLLHVKGIHPKNSLFLAIPTEIVKNVWHDHYKIDKINIIQQVYNAVQKYTASSRPVEYSALLKVRKCTNAKEEKLGTSLGLLLYWPPPTINFPQHQDSASMPCISPL